MSSHFDIKTVDDLLARIFALPHTDYEFVTAGLLHSTKKSSPSALTSLAFRGFNAPTSSVPGYCYLRWFSFLPEAERALVAAALGPCPQVRHVFAHLTLLLPAQPMVAPVEVVAPGLLHVTNGPAVWLSDLTAIFLHTDYHIGSPRPLLVSVLSGAVAATGAYFAQNTFGGERVVVETAIISADLATTGFSTALRVLREIFHGFADGVTHASAEACNVATSVNWVSFAVSTARFVVWRPLSWCVRFGLTNPVVTLFGLGFVALPFLSRRYSRRGVLVFYILALPPTIATIPVWVVPFGRYLLNRLDRLLPARAPPTVVPIAFHLPAPPRVAVSEIFATFARIGGPDSLPDPPVDGQTVPAPVTSAVVRVGGPPLDVDAILRLAQVDTEAVTSALARDVVQDIAENAPHLLNVPSLSLPTRQRTCRVLTYARNLPAAQLALLTSAYPGLTFNPSDRITANSHELNAISRRAETVRLYHEYNLFDAPHIPVSDVGGNILFGARHDLTSVHYCGVIFDARDGARKTTEQIALDTMRGRGEISNQTAARYDANAGSPYRCLRGVNSCTVPAKVAFEIHVYDIPMKNRLEYFDSKGVEKAHQIVFFHPIILLSDSGVLQPAGVSWTRWTNSDGVEYITFSFLEDPNTSYTHEYYSYIAPFMTNIVMTPRGRVYVVERNAPRLNQYEIVYTLVATRDKTHLQHNIRSTLYSDTEDFVLINNYEGVASYYLHPDDSKQIQCRRLLVPRDLWHHALRIAFSNVNKKDRLRIINDSLSSFNSKVSIEGTSLRTTIRLDPITLLCTAAAADGTAFLHFSQAISGLSAVTRAVTDQARSHGITIFELLGITRVGRAAKSFLDRIDDHMIAHQAQIEELTRSRPVNLAEIRSANVIDVNNEVDLVIRQALPRLSAYLPVAQTEARKLESARADLILGVTRRDTPPAPNRAVMRHVTTAVDTWSGQGPPEAKPFFDKIRREAQRFDRRVAPTSQLTFVKVVGDGACLYRAAMIGAGFESRLKADSVVILPESIRALTHHVASEFLADTTTPLTRETFPDTDALALLASQPKEMASLGRPITVEDSETWATTIHLAIFGQMIRANFSNYYITQIKDEKRVVTYPLSTCPNADITAYIHMPRIRQLTHADAWRPDQLPADASARFFTVWTSYFRRLSHSQDNSYDAFFLEYEGVTVNRVSLKLVDMILSHFTSIGVPEAILDIGGAPGHWARFLDAAFPSSHIVTCSPIPDAGSEEFDYALDVLTSYNTENRVLCQVPFAQLTVSRKFDLITCDAATLHSWSTNDVLLEIVRRLPTFQAVGGCCIVKIPNILLDCSQFVRWVSEHYTAAHFFKPRGSRLNSAEVYVVCLDYLLQPVPNKTLYESLMRGRFRLGDAYQHYVNATLRHERTSSLRRSIEDTLADVRDFLHLLALSTATIRVGGDRDETGTDSIDPAEMVFEIDTATFYKDPTCTAGTQVLSADSMFDLIVNGFVDVVRLRSFLPSSFVDCVSRYHATHDKIARTTRLSALRATFFSTILPRLADDFCRDGRLYDCNVGLIKTDVSIKRAHRQTSGVNASVPLVEDIVGVIAEPKLVTGDTPITAERHISNFFPITSPEEDVGEPVAPTDGEVVQIGGGSSSVVERDLASVEAQESSHQRTPPPVATTTPPTPVPSLSSGVPALMRTDEHPIPAHVLADDDSLSHGTNKENVSPVETGSFTLVGTSALSDKEFLAYIRRIDSEPTSRADMIPLSNLSIPTKQVLRTGVFRYSVVIEVKGTLPFPKSLQRVTRVDPLGHRCVIYRCGEHDLPVVRLDLNYPDWTQRLQRLLTLFDRHSAGRRIHVLFAPMPDRYYEILSTILRGQSCLYFCFASHSFARTAPLNTLINLLRSEVTTLTPNDTYRTIFPAQTLHSDAFSGRLIADDVSRITSLRARATAAAREFYSYQSKIRDALKLRLQPIYEDLLMGRDVEKHTGAGYNLINIYTSVPLFADLWGRSFSNMSYAYNGNFIPYDEDIRRFVIPGSDNDPTSTRDTKLALVCADTELMIDEKFLSRHSGQNIHTDRLPHFFWLNGPPGCGKTRFLIRNFSIQDSAILVATRAGVAEVRAALTKHLSACSVRQALQKQRFARKIAGRVRTIASAMLAENPDPSVRTLFIDEATMVHPGQIVYASLCYPNLEKVIMVGDMNQIPFHDRYHVGILQLTLPMMVASPFPSLESTYRCPQDVVFALQNFYPNFHTFNKTVQSMKVLRAAEIPRVKGALYMTFTRAEKQALAPYLRNVEGVVLHTITEAQGLTFENVVVVREQYNDIEIYRNVNQAITAISRHTKTLVYCTRASGDALEDLMNQAICRYPESHIITEFNTANLRAAKTSDLPAQMLGVGLRIGSDSPSPTPNPHEVILAGEFATSNRTPIIVPFLRYSLPATVIGISAGILVYYRGPLTSWRLGNLNSPPVTPLSAGFSYLCRAYGPLLTRIAGAAHLAVLMLDVPYFAFPDHQRAIEAEIETVSGLLPPATTGESISTFTEAPAPSDDASGETAPKGDDLSSVVDSPSPSSNSWVASLHRRLATFLPLLHDFVRAPFEILTQTGNPLRSQSFSQPEPVPLSTPSLHPIGVGVAPEASPVEVPVRVGGEKDVSSDRPVVTDNTTPSWSSPNTSVVPLLAPETPSLSNATLRLNEYIKNYTQSARALSSGDEVYSSPGVDPALVPEVGVRSKDYIPADTILESVYHTEYKVDIPVPTPDLPPQQPIPTCPIETVGSAASIQAFYDEFAPVAAGLEYADDPAIIGASDLDVKIDRLSLDPGKCSSRHPDFSTLIPSLRTMISSRRPNSQIETLLGFMKRNGNAPRLMSGYPPSVVSDLLFNNFVNSVIEPEYLHNFYSYAEALIYPSNEALEEWLKTQDHPETIRNSSQSNTPLIHRVYDLFEYMIKPNVKPPTDPSDATKYQSVQTIAYQPKDINVIFCPIFIVMRDRLMAVMKQKYKFFTGLSPEEFETSINSFLPASTLFSLERVENDISKYDKSMAAYYLLFECALYRSLGMPDELVRIWYISHVRSFYLDRRSGFKAPVDFQRRSGDPSTFLGNTLINLAVVVAIYPDPQIHLCLLAGDDHLLFGDGISYSCSGVFADMFNFEAKTLTGYNYPYFCGKFLLPVHNSIYFVPDPIRLITKLGRRDLRNPEHVEQYRVSLLDVARPLNNAFIHCALSAALTERYATDRTDHSALINSIISIINDRAAFAELYYSLPGMSLLSDPSLPTLDL